MIAYLVRRLSLVAVTLLLVSAFLFAVAQVMPGDIARSILGAYATPEQAAALNHQLGTDRSLWIRYSEWIAGFVSGQWGTSYLLNVDVSSLVLERFRNSLMLGAFALALIVPISIGLGVVAALNNGGWVDRLISVSGLSLIALPEFVTGVILLAIFAVGLRWLPVSSAVPSLNPFDWFRQFILPSIPLMFVLFGYISRMARAGTVEVLASNYVRTAILKGLPRTTVIGRHVLRNSLLPTITVVGAQTGHLVGGLVVTETLFNYPGIGSLLYSSAVGHDLPVLQASVMLVALLYMLMTLIADALYVLFDPKVSFAGTFESR